MTRKDSRLKMACPYNDFQLFVVFQDNTKVQIDFETYTENMTSRDSAKEIFGSEQDFKCVAISPDGKSIIWPKSNMKVSASYFY